VQAELLVVPVQAELLVVPAQAELLVVPVPQAQGAESSDGRGRGARE
jgi:hypothetical protein